MGRKIRVLIVDDSAVVRSVFSKCLTADPEFEVVGFARDGVEALEKLKDLQPDVATLDVEMPRMDGLEALEHVMKDNPTPIVMVSALTREGADVTIRALELGAVDFILKPSGGSQSVVHEVMGELCAKVKLAATAKVRRSPADAGGARMPARPPAKTSPLRQAKAIVIGSSTGGPQALCEVFSTLPGDISAPILLVQHMPEGFTKSLAERLDGLSPLHVEEARLGARLSAGKALLAPGGSHMTVNNKGEIRLNSQPLECGVRPAINVTMESVVGLYGPSTLGVVLTGMGSDGTRGAGLIKKAGGEVIVEEESTCVIYGMPKSVVEAGYADGVVPLPRIASEIARRCRAPSAHEEHAA